MISDETPDRGRAERRHRPLVFVDDLDRPLLADDDHHHLARSLRVEPGAEITVSDGAGRWAAARFGPVAELTEAVRRDEPPSALLTVAFTPVKGDRNDWIVQKVTELGVDRIVPLVTERSIVRWDDRRATKQLAKWHKVAREASMQSRRVTLPSIDPVTPLSAVFDTLGGPALAVADPEGGPLGPATRTLLIGPEGGWAEHEIAGHRLAGLPGGVLRTETAALVGAALMADMRARNRRSPA